MRNFSRLSIFILFIAFIFRISIMLWAFNYRENTDVLRYRDWARISYLYGFADTYKLDHLTFGTLPNNQPPGSVYIVNAAYRFELLTAKIILRITKTTIVANPLIMNGYLPDTFLRLPSLFADILLGAFIYLFVKKKRDENSAILAMCLYLFTPPVWYNSAFWGQMDSLNNLFFFMSIYFLYERKYWRSMIFCACSFFTKISLLPALPLFFTLIYFELGKKRSQFFLMIFVCVICMILLSLPISGLNLLWLFNFYKNNGLGEMQHITNFAFNLWWMLIKPTLTIGKFTTLFNYSQVEMHNVTPDNFKLGFFPLYTWATFLFTCLYIPLFICTVQKKISVQNGLRGLSLSIVIGFLVLPFMHERYLYPVFPLLAVYVGLERKSILVFLLLSIFNMINLYIVWHPMYLWFLPAQIIGNRIFQWIISAGVVFISFYFYVTTLQLYRKHEK